MPFAQVLKSFVATVKFREHQNLKLALKTADKKNPGVPRNDIIPMLPVKPVTRVHLFQGEIIQLHKGFSTCPQNPVKIYCPKPASNQAAEEPVPGRKGGKK